MCLPILTPLLLLINCLLVIFTTCLSHQHILERIYGFPICYVILIYPFLAFKRITAILLVILNIKFMNYLFEGAYCPDVVYYLYYSPSFPSFDNFVNYFNYFTNNLNTWRNIVN